MMSATGCCPSVIPGTVVVAEEVPVVVALDDAILGTVDGLGGGTHGAGTGLVPLVGVLVGVVIVEGMVVELPPMNNCSRASKSLKMSLRNPPS
jgi:hypothetical protein